MTRIFKEGGENKFSTAYIPNVLPHREEQIEQLVGIIRDGIEIDAFRTPILYGETGTGKTTTVIRVLNMIQKMYMEKVRVKRINATTYSKSYMAITALARDVIPVPQRGLSIEEVLNRLYDRLDIQDIYYVFAIDDADELIRREKGRILELLTRIEENYEKRLMLPIVIVRNIKYIDALPRHITSKLGGMKIYFPTYKKEQLKDILKERIEKGIKEGGVTQNAIECATYNTEKLFGGNARELLNVMLKAGKIAEKLEAPSIYSDHVRQAVYEMYSFTLASGISVAKERDMKTRILWALYKAIQEHPDIYYVDDDVLEKAYETYATTFQMEDISKSEMTDILFEMALYETQNLVTLDEGKLVIAHYPIGRVFNELTQKIFF